MMKTRSVSLPRCFGLIGDHRRRHPTLLRDLVLVLCLVHLPAEVSSFTLKYRCQEEQPRGTFIGDLSKELETRGRTETTHYAIIRTVPTNNTGLFFELGERSGLLVAGERLDREAVCEQRISCVVGLDVALRTTDEASLSNIIKIEVTIDDINDNPPFFLHPSLRKSIPESIPPGVVLQLSPALDRDSPGNGVSRYFLEPSTGPFQLSAERNRVTNTVSLKLYLLQGLDREITEAYQLTIHAVDGGQPPRSGSTVIDLQVVDVNDNSPLFSKDGYEATVASDAPVGTSVIQVEATDLDEGVNGQVKYSLTKKSFSLYGGTFRLNDTTGVVTTLRRLDGPGQRMLSSYRLDVVAEDLGENSIPNRTYLRIHVRSVNNHVPVIVFDPWHSSNLQHQHQQQQQQRHLVEIPENNQPQTYLGHVTVVDNDVGESGSVSCSIDDENFSLVFLTEKEFKVITTRSFDREETELYDVKVECSDRGQPPMTSHANLTVKVTDEDDNVPRFLQPTYNCTVAENGPSGVSLIRIQAVDPDSGLNGVVEYTLGSDADARLFRIDAGSGDVFLLESLDREKAELYDFHVVARSGASEAEVTCLVHVIVSDEDDETPHFRNSTYKFEIFENENSGTEVGRVEAVDLDLSPHDVIIYQLEFSPDDHVTAASFAIDPVLGILYTRHMLDREVASHHTMRVHALPGDVTRGVGDVTVVFVKVNDVNDNAPVVTFPSADDDTVFLAGNATGVMNIANLSAYDRDSGRNSELSYSIVSRNSPRSYALHPRSGTLVWNAGNASTSKEDSDCVDVLEIAVRDGGLPVPLTTLTRLYIVFDCHEDTDVDRWRPFKDGAAETSRTSFYFITVTIALVFLVLLLVVMVAKAGGRRHRVDVVPVRAKDDDAEAGVSSCEESSPRLQGDVLGPVAHRRSLQRMPDIVAPSNVELDFYRRENQLNEDKMPAAQENDEDGSSSSEERDNDSGCVDVSSV